MSLEYAMEAAQAGLPPRGANPNPPLPLVSGARGDLIGCISSCSAFVSFLKTDETPGLPVSLGSYNLPALLLEDDEGRLSLLFLFRFWFREGELFFELFFFEPDGALVLGD